MADFKIPLGRSNSGNARLQRARNQNQLPAAEAPEFFWSFPVDLKLLHMLQALAIQTTTVLVTGAAPDGDYTLHFVGNLADGTAFDVTIPAFAASTNTNNQIATGLEALAQTARATTLALIVGNETVNTATVTFVFLAGVVCTVSLTVPATAGSTIARTFACTITPASRIRGERVMPDFPSNVIRARPLLRRPAAIVGLTTPLLIAGDVGDDNGLVTSTSLAVAGPIETTAAQEFADVLETAFVPQVVLNYATTPLTGATAGEFAVDIRYKPTLPN